MSLLSDFAGLVHSRLLEFCFVVDCPNLSRCLGQMKLNDYDDDSCFVLYVCCLNNYRVLLFLYSFGSHKTQTVKRNEWRSVDIMECLPVQHDVMLLVKHLHAS